MEGNTKRRDPSFIAVSAALISILIFLYVSIKPVDLFRGIQDETITSRRTRAQGGREKSS